MTKQIFSGSYLQVKAFAMILDWYSNEEYMTISKDSDAQTVTVEFFGSDVDLIAVNEIWEDVCEQFNDGTEAVVATTYAIEHNWVKR